MQKAILFICLLVVGTVSLSAQRIQGEGDVVKQEIDLETITGVRLGFHGDIVITQGSSQKIVLEGQQNILDNIKREVRNGTWRVNFDKSVKNAKPVKIYITMATLKDAGVSGSGNLSSKGSFTGLGDLELYVSGSGNVDLQVEAEDVDGSISGSGEINLSGSASSVDVSISGSGDFDALDLKSENCEISIAGSGDAAVYVTGSLEVRISGSGDVRYKGDAARVKSSISGSGDVREVD